MNFFFFFFFFFSFFYTASTKSAQPKWKKIKQATQRNKQMRQVDFSNSKKSTEIWGVDFEGDVWYKPHIEVREWSTIDAAPDAFLAERKMLTTKCKCDNGTPSKSSRKEMCNAPIPGFQDRTHRCSACDNGYFLDKETSHCHIRGYQYKHGGLCGLLGKLWNGKSKCVNPMECKNFGLVKLCTAPKGSLKHGEKCGKDNECKCGHCQGKSSSKYSGVCTETPKQMCARNNKGVYNSCDPCHDAAPHGKLSADAKCHGDGRGTMKWGDCAGWAQGGFCTSKSCDGNCKFIRSVCKRTCHICQSVAPACDCHKGWSPVNNVCQQTCPTNGQTRHINGQCRCEMGGKDSYCGHIFTCKQTRCVVASKQELCERNGGVLKSNSCQCPYGWQLDRGVCMQECGSKSTARHRDGSCKCATGTSDTCGTKFQCVNNNKCMDKVPLCTKHGGSWSKPSAANKNLGKCTCLVGWYLKLGVCVQSGAGTNNWYSNECPRDSYGRCKCSSNKDCLNLYTCQQGSCQDTTKKYICERKGGQWNNKQTKLTCNNDYEECKKWCGDGKSTEKNAWGNIPPGCIKPNQNANCWFNTNSKSQATLSKNSIKCTTNSQQCTCPKGWFYDWDGCVQGCSSNEQSRHTTGQCKCGGNAPNNKCKAEHGQHCINQKCVVPTKKWLCEKNSGEWNKPIQKTITQQQKATTYFAYPMKGGGGGLTAGPVISKEEAMESAHYCSKNVKDIKNKHMISGGVASQSKTLNNDIKYLGAQKARDGNRESFTHTPNMDNPWWKLKFDSPKNIEYVSMRNRHNCCGDRLNGARVEVLTVDNKWVKCGSPVSGAQDGKVYTRECPKNLRVTEVKITRPGKNHVLTLAGVEVYTIKGCSSKFTSINPSNGNCMCVTTEDTKKPTPGFTFQNTHHGCNCPKGWWKSAEGICYQQCSNNNQQRNEDGACICNKGGHNDKCHSLFECVHNGCADKKEVVCIEAKLKSNGKLDVAPNFSGPADNLCDTCRDYVGPDPHTPGDAKCHGDRKGHKTNGGNNCGGYKANGWCHGDGDTQKWVQGACQRTCGLCKSAASASADFDKLAVNLDENGNYEKPCCGQYSQCCSDIVSGGVASQSKTLNNDVKNYGAQKAREDNTHMTHTPDMDNPWWKLKFDSPKKIEYVSMRTRIDCCGERLNGAQVTVLTVDNTWVKCGSPVSADNKRGNQNGKVFKKECPKNLRVKEVKITRPGKHLILTLINVEVGQKVDKNKCRAKRLKNQGNNNCKRGSLYKKGGKGDCNTHYHDKGEHGVDACALACGAEAKCKKFTYGKRLGCRISNNGPKDTCPLANYGGDVYTLV